jgi:photosystem II stability/assembly factor-like uncharacterized protein
VLGQYLAGCAAFSSIAFTGPATPKIEPYHWKSVQIVGAGFVDGVVFHPTAKGVRFARTDIGGAYRWDSHAGRWTPMLDWVPYSDLNLMGVESIAVDPTDPKEVYLACGTYTNRTTPDGAVLRSTDGGKRFQIVHVPIKFGGNENGRGNGERLSVDPNSPNRLLLGTRHSGLWATDDFAKSWHRIAGFPAVGAPPGAGVVATLFDPYSSAKGKPSQVEYAAVSDSTGPTLFISTDAGTTWNPISGGPSKLLPLRVALGTDDRLWITYGSSPGPSRMTDGAVWTLKSGTWTDVTPEKPDAQHRFGYAGVSVQKSNPRVAIVSSFYRPGGEQIFRTLDGGQSWRPVIGGKETYIDLKSPYISKTGIHWLFDVEIDPTNPNHAVFTTGYGGHETFNLTDADRGKPVLWYPLAPGIEESVALQLLSPTQGVHLISGIGDYGGFVHADLDSPAIEGSSPNPRFGNTTGVAAGDLAPNIVVRVGSAAGGSREGNIGYSTDGGKSWQPAATSPPNAREGGIAVSADGKIWIWSVRGGVYRTTDAGASWTRVSSIPSGLKIAADHVDPNSFYAVDLNSMELFSSEDGGVSFVKTPVDLARKFVEGADHGDDRGGQDRIYATPGKSGDLWIAAYNGLYHSDDHGKSFTLCPEVDTVHAFGFGKEKPGSSFPALFLVGTVEQKRGIYRSDDSGKSWVEINDPAHQWGLVLQIAGDPRIYGRAYVGTHGRGIFYGTPVRG